MLGPMPPYRTLEYSYWLQALAWFSLGCDRQLRSKPVGENIENVSVLSSLFHSVFKINIEKFLKCFVKIQNGLRFDSGCSISDPASLLMT